MFCVDIVAAIVSPGTVAHLPVDIAFHLPDFEIRPTAGWIRFPNSDSSPLGSTVATVAVC